MTRFGRFATLIALISGLLYFFMPTPANRAAAQAGNWQAAPASANPFRKEAPAEWAPSRAHLTDASTEPAALPPSAGSLASVKTAPDWSAPSTTTHSAKSAKRAQQPHQRPRSKNQSKSQQHEANRSEQAAFIPHRSIDRPVLRDDRQPHRVAQRRPQSTQQAQQAQPVAQAERDSRWLMPNQKPTQAAAHVAQARHTQGASAQRPNASSRPSASRAPREPREFVPPTAAAQMNGAAQPSRQSLTAQAEQAPQKQAQSSNSSLYHGSSAVAPAAALEPVNDFPQPMPTNRARTQHGPATQTTHKSHRDRVSQGLFTSGTNSGSIASRMRHTMNVAFEGPESWAAYDEGEELPLPGRPISQGESKIVSPNEHVPMLQEEGGYEVVDGPVFSDGYGGCSDGTCYGEAGYGCADGACQCGDACEPGCGCGSNCGGGNCGSKDLFCVGCGDDQSCHTVRLRIPKWQELMIFAGVQGFKGPYDQARDSGNFGFHQGFNAGFKVPYTSMGYQIGYQAVESQLSGDKDTDISDPHTQQFVTAGLFQRTVHGFQGGAVWDVLRDERWGAVDFHQIRAEISYIDRGCHEIGFTGAFHLNQHEAESQDDDGTTVWQASDQYLLFYRFHGKRGGEGRFYAGVNDDSDAIIGSDMMLPLTDRWSLQPGFTYLIPDEDGGEVGAAQEAWNIGIAMVWHWDCRARKCYSSCYRPLFNVANNGYLIVDDRPGAAPVNGVGQAALPAFNNYTIID